MDEDTHRGSRAYTPDALDEALNGLDEEVDASSAYDSVSESEPDESTIVDWEQCSDDAPEERSCKYIDDAAEEDNDEAEEHKAEPLKARTHPLLAATPQNSKIPSAKNTSVHSARDTHFSLQHSLPTKRKSPPAPPIARLPLNSSTPESPTSDSDEKTVLNYLMLNAVKLGSDPKRWDPKMARKLAEKTRPWKWDLKTGRKVSNYM